MEEESAKVSNGGQEEAIYNRSPATAYYKWEDYIAALTGGRIARGAHLNNVGSSLDDVSKVVADKNFGRFQRKQSNFISELADTKQKAILSAMDEQFRVLSWSHPSIRRSDKQPKTGAEEASNLDLRSWIYLDYSTCMDLNAMGVKIPQNRLVVSMAPEDKAELLTAIHSFELAYSRLLVDEYELALVKKSDADVVKEAECSIRHISKAHGNDFDMLIGYTIDKAKKAATERFEEVKEAKTGRHIHPRSELPPYSGFRVPPRTEFGKNQEEITVGEGAEEIIEQGQKCDDTAPNNGVTEHEEPTSEQIVEANKDVLVRMQQLPFDSENDLDILGIYRNAPEVDTNQPKAKDGPKRKLFGPNKSWGRSRGR